MLKECLQLLFVALIFSSRPIINCVTNPCTYKHNWTKREKWRNIQLHENVGQHIAFYTIFISLVNIFIYRNIGKLHILTIFQIFLPSTIIYCEQYFHRNVIPCVSVQTRFKGNLFDEIFSSCVFLR